MERNDMAEHNNGKTVRTNSQVMDLSQLIAGPLVAAREADAMASRSYFDFLTQVAFDGFNQNSGKAGALRMLSFEYDDRDGSGICRKRVSIPLLTLISFPLDEICSLSEKLETGLLVVFAVFFAGYNCCI